LRPVRRLALSAFCLAALALPANAAATTLHARVLADRTIDLRYDDGTPVTHLDPGEYTIEVNDATIGHTFHLRGPDVDRTTGPGGAFTGTATWNVTLADGLHEFFCDIHPGAMYGTFTVGNVLTIAKAGTGIGTVSSPSGVSCGFVCSVGMPLTTSVTLTATPLGGSVFKGWVGGGCSGTGPCTVFAAPGETTVIARFDWDSASPPPPPPPPATVSPSATVSRVAVVRVSGRRVVRVRLAVARHTATTARLRRAGKTLASAAAHVAPGTRTVVVRVPRAAKPGFYAVAVRLVDAVSGDAWTATRRVKIPAP
jgi:hypothetical protein